jgi:hypothetical protein
LEIKAKIDKLNEQLKTVNESAKAAMLRAGIRSWHDGNGAFNIRDSFGVTSIDRNKIIESMLKHGISADTVNEIVEEGSKTTTRKEFIEFRIGESGE